MLCLTNEQDALLAFVRAACILQILWPAASISNFRVNWSRKVFFSSDSAAIFVTVSEGIDITALGQNIVGIGARSVVSVTIVGILSMNTFMAT